MKDTIYSSVIESPIGPLTLSEKNGKIIAIRFGKTEICGTIKETEILLQCRLELEEYFSGLRREFTVPTDPQGTEFQLKVWKALTEIPYGKVCSYGDIARNIGSPKAVRAVGGANHRNPIPIIIPCHRVISSDGTLGGYAPGPEPKIKLLALEDSLPGIKTK